jgi:hypothetical protein
LLILKPWQRANPNSKRIDSRLGENFENWPNVRGLRVGGSIVCGKIKTADTREDKQVFFKVMPK